MTLLLLKATGLAILLVPLLLMFAFRPTQTLGLLMLGAVTYQLTVKPHRARLAQWADEHLPHRVWRRNRQSRRVRRSFEEIVGNEDWDSPQA